MIPTMLFISRDVWNPKMASTAAILCKRLIHDPTRWWYFLVDPNYIYFEFEFFNFYFKTPCVCYFGKETLLWPHLHTLFPIISIPRLPGKWRTPGETSPAQVPTDSQSEHTTVNFLFSLWLIGVPPEQHMNFKSIPCRYSSITFQQNSP